MEKIKSYIDRFFRKTKKNLNYTLKSEEMSVFMETMINSKDADRAFKTATTLFDYGYVKGYRAALSEMKKGGAA